MPKKGNIDTPSLKATTNLTPAPTNIEIVRDASREEALLDDTASNLPKQIHLAKRIFPSKSQNYEERILDVVQYQLERISKFPHFKKISSSESPLEYLREVKKKIDYVYDENSVNDLGKDIQRWYAATNIVENVAVAMTVPYQVVLGMLLLRLQNLCKPRKNYLAKAREFCPDISQKSRDNYVAAAKLVGIINDDRILICNMTTIYQLSSLYDKKVINEDDTANSFLYAAHAIANKDMFSDEDYQRVARYVCFQKTMESKQYALDTDKFKELYDSGYDITEDDVKAVTTYSSRYKAVPPNEFANEYIKTVFQERKRDKALVKLGLKQARGQSNKSKGKRLPSLDHRLADVNKILEKYLVNNKKLDAGEFKYVREVEKKFAELRKKNLM